MTLTGLVTNEHNLLVKGELDAGTTKYPGCQCSRTAEETSSTLIHRLSSVAKTEPTCLPKGRQGLGKIRAVFMETGSPGSKIDLLKLITRVAIQIFRPTDPK